MTVMLLMWCLSLAAQQADTWVATDGLGRQMPTFETAPLKEDKQRTVGIFHITWHDEGKYGLQSPYGGDVTQTLLQDPNARKEIDNPVWKEWSLHWGEPEWGYFLSQDRWVVRHDLSMLSDAGVDVLILDVTNAVLYWDEWEVLFDEMQRMRRLGNRVPQFCFWAFNGPVVSVVQQLYERIYRERRYSDFWFMWEDRPLLLYNATPQIDSTPNQYEKSDYSDEVKSFFTLRNMWWGYDTWGGKPYVGTEDNWAFGYELHDPRVMEKSPFELASRHHGEVEEMAVTPAQHPLSVVGKSWRRNTGEPSLDEYDLPDSAFVPWLGWNVARPGGYGIYFQDRWDEALQVDPPFIYLNDWNEWTAGRYRSGFAPGSNTAPGPTTFLGRDNPFYFVDQYNSEFNRTIQPMKGGYTDNYYMQMVQNIRRYKGVHEQPAATGRKPVSYEDTRGDVLHRDHNGYGGCHYTDSSGRNDIVKAEVRVEGRYVKLAAETDSLLTPHTENNWMLLLIDADQDAATGWEGYDLLVNRSVKDDHTTTVFRFDNAENDWKWLADVPLSYEGRRVEVTLPRSILGQKGRTMAFDFKWADNPSSLDNIITVSTTGDTAPNRRFNYRFRWQAKK
ncbi:MAG: hypothetical protein IJ196_08215 [Prevotella sp.]|nr:hypothetical protein [Prevotella sp.]